MEKDHALPDIRQKGAKSIMRIGVKVLSRYVAPLTLALAVLGLPFAASAQDQESGQKFVGVPLTDDVIVGELYLKSGERVRFHARNGTVVSVQNPDYHYGFTSKITPEGEVSFIMYDIQTVPGPDGGEVANVVGSAVSGVGSFAQGDLPLDIKVLGVGPASFESPFFSGDELNTPELRRLAERSSSCCVVACDGTIVCGCAVDTGCSSCCSGSCCSFSGEVFQRGFAGPGDP